MALNSQVVLRVSRFLSYTVIGMSSIMRLPQVFAILQAGNSTGLNVKAYWMDLTACLIGRAWLSSNYIHGSWTYCNPSFYYNIPSDTL